MREHRDWNEVIGTLDEASIQLRKDIMTQEVIKIFGPQASHNKIRSVTINTTKSIKMNLKKCVCKTITVTRFRTK